MTTEPTTWPKLTDDRLCELANALDDDDGAVLGPLDVEDLRVALLELLLLRERTDGVVS